MNDFTFDSIKVGEKAEFKRIVTQEMMDAFLFISGDCNPLHVDEEYAKKQGFDACVCYGAISSAMFSTLAGVYLPGRRCLLHGIECIYKKPVFVDDTLTVKGEVSEVSEVFREITVKVKISNQNGQLVTRGVIKAGII